MMENVYLQEAFKALDILNEEDFNLTSTDGFEDAKDFIDKDEKSDFIDVIDPEAETEEELKDSYVGDVILDCCVCHSKLYKHPEEVHLDEEEGLANMDEECPFCYSTDGYTIVGQVAPFEEAEEEKEEIDGEVEIEDEEEVEDDVNESFKRKRKLKEAKTPYAGKTKIMVIGDHQYPAGSWSNIDNNFYEYTIPKALDKLWDIADSDYWTDRTLPHEEWHCFANMNDSDPEDLSKVDSEFIQDLDNLYQFIDKCKSMVDEGNTDYIIIEDDDGNILLRYGTNKYFNKTEVEEGLGGTLLGGAGGAALGGAALGPLGALGGAALGGLAGNALTNNNLTEDADISEYQKWVDFDMEKYGKISNLTMRKIKKAGFSVVKDQYGEYEVIADRKDESLLNETTETDAVLDETTWRKLPLAVQDRLESYWNAEVNNKVFKPYLTALEDTGVLTSSEVIAILKSNIEDGYATTIDESCKKRPVREHFEKVEIETDKEKMEMTAEENGKVVVTTEPKNDEEVIVPVSDGVQTEINDVVEIEDEPVEEEPMEDGDYEDIDVDEFSEEEFDDLGESYLKKVYENVKSFKTSNVKTAGNKLFVEGIIGFASGKNKKTSFVFESKDVNKKGKVRFIGENLQLSRGKKAFTITGSINKGKFIAESLNYNYRAKDSDGKSTRLYGTVRTKK